MGWLPNRLPVTVVAWLYNEVPARRAAPRRGSKEARAPALESGMPAAASGSVTTVGSVLMAEVMIGIDPHKGSHTAVAIGAGEEPLGELRVDACPSQAERAAGVGGGVAGAGLGGGGRGRAGALCWPSSWSPPGSRCWMCRPSWPPGCGCCRPGPPTRTIPTTPSRWRSRRCAPRPGARCSPRITPRC